MFSFILFRRNINYLLPRFLNVWKPDILPRITKCYDVHASMPQHQYSASYMYIITVNISLYNILKGKISNLTTYSCVMASTDLSAFSLFIRQNFITIHLQPASIPPSKCSFLLRRHQCSSGFKTQHLLCINSFIKPISQFYSLSEKKLITNQISYKRQKILNHFKRFCNISFNST